MRTIAKPFVVARPSGASVRTRLRVSPTDEAVLFALGEHLATLANRDLAQRVRISSHLGRQARVKTWPNQ